MKIIAVIFALIINFNLFAQVKKAPLIKPKLVVGIVIDQMRWDYLQRFEPLYKSNGGFKRMMNNGYSCSNTMVPYTPTVTACGHTCVYTGSVPNIHGIVGNDWYDKNMNANVYCTEDTSVTGIGITKGNEGKMSPKNLLATTIGDELHLATNFKSKVIGVSFKNRGAILPAGHSANAAYWFDKGTGNFISSSYYKMPALPDWLINFNKRNLADSCFKMGWQTLLPASVYQQYCSDDEKDYENKVFGKEQKAFPYNLQKFIGKDYEKIIYTPYGNYITAELAKSTIQHEQMGKNSVTDFIAISFSSPDYIGHSFGPNSWEMLDCYIKLDDELGKLFDFLDKEIGVGNYVSFLTADHAVAHVPGFLKEHNLPGGIFEYKAKVKQLNDQLKAKYGIDKAIIATHNYQLTLNHKAIDSLMAIDSMKVDKDEIINTIIEVLKKDSCIANAFELDELTETPMNSTVKSMLENGYYPSRSGDIQFILKPGYFEDHKTGTTHGLWNPYDAHIPLLWYGWGIKKGNTHRLVYMTDIAATLAAMLHIQMPSGCVGKVITEIVP